jgi:hypothetical protein
MPRIFVEKRALPAKYLIMLSLLILVSCFIPIIKINQRSYSILSFVLNGSIAFSIMLFGYLIAFFLLMKKDPSYDYASAAVYFISWIFSCVGNLRHVPNSAINENRLLGFIWISIYILLPMVNGLFYLSLIMVPKKQT